jgi:hypothetical protein
MVYFNTTRSNCGDDGNEYLAMCAGTREPVLTSNITVRYSHVMRNMRNMENVIVLLSTLVYTAISTQYTVAPLRASIGMAVVKASRAGCAVCVGHRPVY